MPSLSPDFDGPFPALTRASTVPASLQSTSAARMAKSAAAANDAALRRTDPYHLAPEDAFYTSVSPPWDRHAARNHHAATNNTNNTSSNVSGNELRESSRGAARQALRPGSGGGNLRRTASGALVGSSSGIGLGGLGTDSRSRSRRRRRRTWKKLLWVKQSCMHSLFALPPGLFTSNPHTPPDPDNYTDQATFLENLQRNPRLQPYDFWPLVADSTVIVQHVCSVIIFIICFVGIFQERVSPVAVVGWGTIATCMGWLLWEYWADQEQSMSDDDDGNGGADDYGHAVVVDESRASQQSPRHRHREPSSRGGGGGSADLSPPSALHANPSSRRHKSAAADVPAEMYPSANSSTTSLLNMSNRYGRNNGSVGYAAAANGGYSAAPSTNTSRSASAASTMWPVSELSGPSGAQPGGSQAGAGSTTLGSVGGSRVPSAQSQSATEQPPTTPATPRYPPPRRPLTPVHGGRMHHRVATVKSAVLIYFTLLGLSPILKSLTRSTSSDSIWAMSFWLLAINIFFFDYSGVWVGAHKFPVASLSTNAALMASTVLASRLPSTGQVFSLTLFSIEVFGLFPVFRRYARHRSWRYHIGLTALLVLGAGAGVGIILTGPGEGLPWRSAIAGMVVGCVLSAVAMGGCSWWLIGLQKYKNEIYGPWDPARPVIISRRHWNDM